MHARTPLAPALALTLLVSTARAQEALRRDMPDRLLYCSTNLQVAENVDRLAALFARAAGAGYTGVLLADSKFARLGDLPAHYFANARRVKDEAEASGLEIVPALFPIGYSNDLLWHDPNLAEALPVRDALFVVRGGVASLAPDPAVSLPGSDMSDLSRWSWHDENVVSDGGAALVADPRGRNARLVQRLTLQPFRQYHVSVRVRTEQFRGIPEIKALAARREGEAISLVHSSLGVEADQDWTTHHVVFNTLEHSDVSLYFGCWDGSTGSLWWDDARIEEVGLLNLVRRDGAPLSVRLESVQPEGEPLREGTDYERVVDPLMGVQPWPGEYTVWHEPPQIRLIRPLPDGARLRVSYHHVVTIHDGQVMICPSEPRTVELLRDQARRMHELWNADAYFMSHDEVRCLNQDEACRRRALTAGEILADNVRTCIDLLRQTAPEARVYVWSDMFDPNHNARDDYYLVRTSLAGSWDGLDAGVIVACWYFDKRRESIDWFTSRGHHVLAAGYYDGPVPAIRDWMRAAQGVTGFRGVMYTTWRQRYEDLEEFAEQAWGR